MNERRDRDEFESRWRTTGLAMAPTVGVGSTIRADALAATGIAGPPVPTPAADAASEAPRSGPVLPRIALALQPRKPSIGAQNAATDLVVVRRLGEGGMGAVDLARQQSLARDVAVKRLRDGPMDAGAAAALLSEGRTTGALEHPGIVPVHALGVDDEMRPVLVMKRIEGVSWAELASDAAHPSWVKLAPDGQDRLATHVEILRQVCNALDFAHSRGVLHRDIKPENVMIGGFGEVYLLDWGVALHRETLSDAQRSASQLVGTPCFMAPEMFGGTVGDLDERSDVYLLGATLHAILTGRPRHEGSSLHAVLLAAWDSAPVAYSAAVPEELATLCNAATAHDRDGRPQSVAAFRQHLADYVQRRGSVAIARSARASLDRARALEGSSAPPDAWRLMSEARFGFVQALREWPGNTDAREGLQTSLEALVERELALRSPQSARSLLDEMPGSAPLLRQRLARLETEIAAEKSLVDEGRREVREQDKSVSSRTRMLTIGFGGLVMLLIVAIASISQGRQPGRATLVFDLLAMDALIVTALLIAVAVGRRTMLGNRVSRQMTLALVTMVVAGVVVDLVSWRFGADLLVGAVNKFVAGAGALTVGAATVDRALFVPAGILAGSIAVMFAWPASIENVSSLATLLVVLSMMWAARRHGRQSPSSRS